MTSSVRARVLACGLLWLLGAASPSSVARADSLKALEGFSCTSEPGVQAWIPMAGSRAVSVTNVAGRAALRMPCNFHGTDIERASWDHPVKGDLAMCRGVQFLFYCSDPSAVANFTLYLRSGDGWYRGVFDAPAAGQWVPIRVAKADMNVEGQPAGWSKIDTLRISAWRGQDRDTEFYVTDFALFGGDAKIVIVRGDSAAKRAPAEMGAVREYTSVMAGMLERANLPYLVLSDRDVTAGRLREARLVILPHNPAMPDAIVEREGHTMVITMNRPKRYNALPGAMLIRMYDAMVEAEKNGVEYESILDPPPADPSLCHPESTRPSWAPGRNTSPAA